MYRAIFVGLLVWFWGGVASAQTVSEASDYGAFRAHRAKGMAALEAGELDKAAQEFSLAQGLINDSPSLLLLQAQTALERKDEAAAKGFLREYLTRGFVVDLEKTPEFAPLMDNEAALLQAKNIETVGNAEAVFVAEDYVLPSAIAIDADQTLYVASLGRNVVMRLQDYTVTSYLKMDTNQSAYGVAVAGDLLWVSLDFSYLPAASSGASSGPLLLAYDRHTGKIIHRLDAKALGGRRVGALTPSGHALFMVDQKDGTILKMTAPDQPITAVVPAGFFNAPQALLPQDDGQTLIIADYNSGLYRADFAAGTLTRLIPPNDGSLLGISALFEHKGRIIAVQNAFAPARVLSFAFNDEKTGLTDTKILVKSADALHFPTQGVILGDALIMISHSQWKSLNSPADVDDATPLVMISVPLE